MGRALRRHLLQVGQRGHRADGHSAMASLFTLGYFENRNPSASFDSAYYRSRHPDVRDEGINPLLHYAMFGRQEERSQAPPLALEPQDCPFPRRRDLLPARGPSPQRTFFARRAQTVR